MNEDHVFRRLFHTTAGAAMSAGLPAVACIANDIDGSRDDAGVRSDADPAPKAVRYGVDPVAPLARDDGCGANPALDQPETGGLVAADGDEFRDVFEGGTTS